MAAQQDDRSTLVYALETLEPIRDEIERRPDTTIKPGMVTADEQGQLAIASLMHAAQRDRTVTLGDTIGQGGMGLVYLAEQVALGRVVAVKKLRAEHSTDRHVLALMREAWVTGGLEHPNIVPVHDVGIDADGSPFLVMKRIEGVHWGELIRHPEHVRERFGVEDVQAWHLRVLVSVCHAVAFAHDRGVIHRDLKPENVMVGAFGEVYLLDWGIAATLSPDPTGRLPLVKHEAVVGTPAYMAPEMIGPGEVGPWSDIYLLGGLLYEILTGDPPHRGRDLQTLLDEITGEVVSPDGPGELTTLCMEALSPHAEERPGSAEEFRIRVVRHLEHRSALELAAEASETLQRLLAALDEPGSDRDTLWNQFGEVRFGFRQALKAWPEHPEAAEGLRRAVSAMVRFELDADDAPGAARLLAQDPIEDEDLEALVREGVQQAAHRARDQDARVGQRTRWFVAVNLALLWSIMPLMGWYQGALFDHHYTIWMDALFVGLVLALGAWARESLSQTALNRSTWAVLLLAPFGQMILTIGALNLGIDPLTAHPLHLFFWSVLAAVVTVTTEWRFWPTATTYVAGFLVVSSVPEDYLLVAGIANLALAANICIVWWPGEVGWRRPRDDRDADQTG